MVRVAPFLTHSVLPVKFKTISNFIKCQTEMFRDIMSKFRTQIKIVILKLNVRKYWNAPFSKSKMAAAAILEIKKKHKLEIF